MRNEALVRAILEGREVSVVVVGEDATVDTLKMALRMAYPHIKCGDAYITGGKRLNLRIPPLETESARQRVISALEQTVADVQYTEPPPNHEIPPQ